MMMFYHCIIVAVVAVVCCCERLRRLMNGRLSRRSIGFDTVEVQTKIVLGLAFIYICGLFGIPNNQVNGSVVEAPTDRASSVLTEEDPCT